MSIEISIKVHQIALETQATQSGVRNKLHWGHTCTFNPLGLIYACMSLLERLQQEVEKERIKKEAEQAQADQIKALQAKRKADARSFYTESAMEYLVAESVKLMKQGEWPDVVIGNPKYLREELQPDEDSVFSVIMFEKGAPLMYVAVETKPTGEIVFFDNLGSMSVSEERWMRKDGILEKCLEQALHHPNLSLRNLPTPSYTPRLSAPVIQK